MTALPTSPILRHLRRAALPGGDLTDGQLLGRFVARRDGAAFAELVRRHGPMVLGACRRLLRDPHDADDAFQATFLVLLRRAGAVRPRERVGPWLYGVACRTAQKAKTLAARRRAGERRAGQRPAPEPAAGPCPDLRALLDRELLGLPTVYRSAVILCDLEGRSRREAARQLGWSEGTLSGRLARARQLLARRLECRGVTLSVAALAAVLEPGVPAPLSAAAVRAAVSSAGGAAPAQVLLLTEGVVRAMMVTKLKIVGAVALALGIAVSGGTWACYPGTGASAGAVAAAMPDEKPKPSAAAEPSAAELIEPPDILSLSYTGKPADLRAEAGGERLVRPDGTVALGSYGTVSVSGLTVEQARQVIARHLKRQDTEFDIDKFEVRVAAWNSRVVYVITDFTGALGGEQVFRLPLAGSLTVLDALNQVTTGVFEGKRVWIARPRPKDGGKDQILPVDWPGITQRGETKTNYQLLPGDRVYVKSASPAKDGDRPEAAALGLPPQTDRGVGRRSLVPPEPPQHMFLVGQIVIVGNEVTPDETIRRVAQLRPGDTVSAGDLKAAEGRLIRLGRFEVDPPRGVVPTVTVLDPNKAGPKDVLIRVREKKLPVPAGTDEMFVNSRELELPVEVPLRPDPVRELVLFLSDDRGRTYKQYAVAAADKKQFRVHVPRDGEYWFVLQVLTSGGTVVPENVSSAKPNLKVRVDTTPPVGELKAVALPGGRVCAGWSVRDENLDEASVGLEYRAAGSGAWQPLTVRPAADGAHVWEPAVRGPVEVRLRAKDRAGNATEVTAKAEPGDGE